MIQRKINFLLVFRNYYKLTQNLIIIRRWTAAEVFKIDISRDYLKVRFLWFFSKSREDTRAITSSKSNFLLFTQPMLLFALCSFWKEYYSFLFSYIIKASSFYSCMEKRGNPNGREPPTEWQNKINPAPLHTNLSEACNALTPSFLIKIFMSSGVIGQG